MAVVGEESRSGRRPSLLRFLGLAMGGREGPEVVVARSGSLLEGEKLVSSQQVEGIQREDLVIEATVVLFLEIEQEALLTTKVRWFS